jgi:microcystin-dependent protein
MKNSQRSLFILAALISFLAVPRAFACPSTPTIAQMCVVAFDFAPRNWFPAQGQLLSISSHTALFSIVGTSYGGDGRTNFALPDTRGRVVIGAGNGPGLANYPVGIKGGVEQVTLTVSQLPSHNHQIRSQLSAELVGTIQIKGVGGRANRTSLDGNAMARNSGSTRLYKLPSASLPLVDMHPDSLVVSAADIVVTGTADVALNNTGSSTAHENRMPSLTMRWIIAAEGIYPSRS